MKIPKSIRMFGYTWKIKRNNRSGGAVNWEKEDKPAREILIGRRYGEQEMVLLHELTESVLIHNLVRYHGNEVNQEFIFNFDHTRFCVIVKDLYQVLKENKLI